jgi:hypothetical protein
MGNSLGVTFQWDGDLEDLFLDKDDLTQRTLYDATLLAASNRWIPGTLDPSVYVPGDIPALRQMKCGWDILNLSESGNPEFQIIPSAMYRAAPFFISEDLVLPIVESDPPTDEMVDNLRLPFPIVWAVFAHPLDLPEELVWPEGVDLNEKNLLVETSFRENIAAALTRRGGYIDGVVLFGKPGGGLSDRVCWTVSANPDPSLQPPFNLDRQHSAIFALRTTSELDHCSKIVACLIADASNWKKAPKELPTEGKPGTRTWRRSLQTNKGRRALLAGAGLGIHVIDIRSDQHNGSQSDLLGPARAAHAVRGHFRGYWVGSHSSPDRHIEPRWVAPYVTRGAQTTEQPVWRLPSRRDR